jgi:hypothetical protein
MDVSSVAEQLLFSTVRIESINSDGIPQVGTGLIFSYETKGEEEHSLTSITQYIVTCKHVVENCNSGRLTFLTGKTEREAELGKTVRYVNNTNFGETWFGNSNKNIDIAIFPINDLFLFFSMKGESIFYRAIRNDMIPDENSLKEIDALEEVIFIGYPWGLWDEKNFLPVFRKGITASPITVDFEGDKKFLIDASVFPGSSGSPVFLFNQGAHNPKSGGIRMGTRLKFLGIVSESYRRELKGKIEYFTEKTKHNKKGEIIPVPITSQFLNIGIVFKSSAIIDTIQEFLPHYQEWRKMMGRENKSDE